MKKNKLFTVLALAFAACAMSMPASGLTGDIVDIRVVDTDEMLFGARNDGDPKQCSASTPLVSGDELYVRVRMIVANYQAVVLGQESPLTWKFFPTGSGSTVLNKPKLGLYIGDRPAYAELSETGYYSWQKSGALDNDDAGNATTAWSYYTDFYFVYKVQPGDLGLPVKLMNSTGTGPASGEDTDSGYYLLNCVSPNLNWVLANDDGTSAKFSYNDPSGLPAMADWPTGGNTPTRLLNYDLSAEGAFVKTIDFDNVNAAGESYSEGDVWRYVYPGMSAAPATIPTLLIGGGESTAPTTVYIWSADESVVVPVASGANTIITEGGKTVLKVLVPAGASSVTFSMKGADGAAVGAVTNIYLSPVKGNVTKPSGELVDVTVTRTVEVITAPEPTVTIFLDGDQATAAATADADYVTAKKQLAIKMTPSCDEDVVVRLNASVSGDDTLSNLTAVYNENILRIADGSYGGDPLNEKMEQVTIPKHTSVVYLNVYVLGGTSKTYSKGVTFSTTKVSGPDKVTTKGSCTLRVQRSTPTIVSSDPAFSTEESPSTVTVVSGASTEFKLELADAYRELNDTATGYTFKWACEGEDIDDDDGITMDEDGLFVGSAKFWNLTDGKELTLCVVNPDGKTSAKVKYNLVVTKAKTTTISLTDQTRLVFAEGETAWVNLGISQPYKGTGYIFLGADDEATLACVTGAQFSTGAQIAQGTTTVDAPRQMRFLDGDCDATVKAILCSANDLSTKVTTYVEGTLSFTITNVPPQVTSVTAAGHYLTPDMNGQTIDPVSRGVAKTFSLVVADVEADLKAAGDKAMAVKWEIDGATYEVFGDPSTNSVKHTFAEAKPKAQVRVYVKDKDMLAYPSAPNFSFYVPVTEKPGITISMSGQGSFNETEANVSEMYVTLSEPATSEIVVRFTLSNVADGGFLRIRNVAGSVTNVYKEVDGEFVVDPNAYDLVFNTGVTRKTLIVAEMDGTDGTLAGMDANAKVITETENTDGVKWCDFYTPAEPLVVKVENEAPQIIRPTEDEAAYTNMNASANTPYAISYACRDVPADMASNIVVEISVDGTLVFTTNVNSTAAGTYPVEFSGEGAHVVEVSFTDKDQMTSRRALNFYVQPSKNLQLRAHGPAPSMGTSGGYSVHYGLAPGLGAGRVYAGDTGPQKVQNFIHSYSFGITASSVDAYAYGYKADEKFDDGSLTPSPDKGIDEFGNWSKGQVFGDGESKYYNYTSQHKWGKLGYDSFLFAWACNNSDASTTTGGDSQTTKSLILNPGAGGSVSIPLPEADDDKKALPMQYWEAVFSREYLKADNCGDINLDGVPDVAVMYYGMGIYGPSGEILKTDGEGDLTKLDSYNKDLDKDGAEAPDYLPSTATSVYGSLIPGLAGTWATQGSEFTAKLEIRGYHEGLNDAMEQLGFSDVESDLIYAEYDEDEGEWHWTENCTISELEYFAWTEYAAAHDWSPGAWTNADGSVRWSPERPTSPTLNDYDYDGFDDGYEYYFWYRAHVGYMDNGVHKRISGRRYDPKNPGTGTIITPEEIEKIFDPRVAFDTANAATRDTDNDGLPDLLEFEIGTNPLDFDTDGDGLADGWELMIAGLNPLLMQSAKDALNDGERNYDGDAMAITSYKLEQVEIPAPKHPEIAQFTTFAVADPDDTGDWEKIQWYAVKGEVKTRTDTWDAWNFKLADGTEVISFVYPRVTDDGRLAFTISRSDANIVSTEEMTIVDDSDPDNPVETKEDVLVAGWPIRLEAGTLVDVDSIPDDDEEVVVYVYRVDGDIEAKDAFGAWVYGKGTGDENRGAVADSAAEYGCLALGGPKKVLDGACICAMPSTDRDVALLHYLVYQQFGFDPRTAWSPKNPLAARWGKVVNGDVVDDVAINRAGGYCAVPARTRAYTAYDEFLVYSFFLNNGCDMGGYATTIADSAPYLAKVWSVLTTNPQGPNEPDNITLNTTTTDGGDAAAQYFYGFDSENGADTDGDGVPDGWELYVMSGPKTKKGEFVFAPPYASFHPSLAADGVDMPKSYFSPFVPSAQKNDTNNQIYLGGEGNDDGLNEFQEFASTDAMNYYAGVYEGAETTIVHDGDWKWFNKFFPTNPWLKDTDGDGLSDSAEKDNFAYTCKDCEGPADDGKLLSIPGGGLNPCSVDTDNDGLPDPWEVQFKGSTPFPGELPAILADKGDRAKDAENNEIGNYLQGLVDGMDGTVKDAYSYPIEYAGASGTTNGLGFVTADGFKQVVNRDYDRDGLENWQEYQTGMMRCWRYDDPLSPWIPIPRKAYFIDGLIPIFQPNLPLLNELYDLEMEDMDDFWTNTLVDKTSPIYNPGLVTDVSSGAQYLSPVTNVWDSCFIDTRIGGRRHAAYYWFYNRVGDTKIDDLWAPVLGIADGMAKAPTRYACCSPLDPDSDHDGMDDYYELFHGMNPILGLSGINLASQNPCDLVYESWDGATKPAMEAWGGVDGRLQNFWQLNHWKAPRGNEYDFEVFPWLTGIVDADPDGDGLPNQTEAIFPKLSAPELHSDPTPLWMTDSSHAYSLVNRFFRMPTRYDDAKTQGDSFFDGTTDRDFKDFPGWVPATDFNPPHFGRFAPDSWKLAHQIEMNWMFSFEENEGYDSDHDGLSDVAEKEGKYRKATDVLDADSPRRRQAMYFQGPERPSALQTMAQVVEHHPVQATSYPDEMEFRTFTVECWVKPESLDDSVIVERSVCISVENPSDEEYVRKNFQVGIKDGYWYAKFDPYTTLSDDAVTAVSKTGADVTKWTHLAATYDGNDLVLYVNGVAERVVRSGLLPAYGSIAVVVHRADAGGIAQSYWSDIEYKLFATVVGASLRTVSEGATEKDFYAHNLVLSPGWRSYTKFYKGWVDEVRVWDGARTSAEISETFRTRFTSAMVEENRANFYDKWALGWRRDGKDENGNAYALPAELRYHWSFDSIFGAENEAAVATAPHGFNDIRAVTSRAEGYEVGWWSEVLAAYDDAVYNDPVWVPWIPNTVAHMPRFDGTTLDSMFWSEDFMGDAAGTYRFDRTAEPASLWTQFMRNGTNSDKDYGTTDLRHYLVNLASAVSGSGQAMLFEFNGRHLNQSGDDLLPLGGAFARYCDNDVGLWDGQGASSNWEVSGTDADGDGLPDWWEQYADENYRRPGMDPSEEIGWETIVSYNGVEMTAGEAYLRDLAHGAYLNEAGEIAIGEATYEQRADEDGNGVPDWWEEMYGITGESGLDDHDNDGLPNYVEYLLSEVFKFEGVAFDPTNPRSVDDYTLDYFYRVGSLYVGEIFTDHDQVDDSWEDYYKTLDDGTTPFASRFAYDASADVDEDGWSNRSEARYSKMVMPIVANAQNHYTAADGLLADYPIPTLALTLRYNGERQSSVNTAPIIVQVSRSARNGELPDAEYFIGAVAQTEGSTGQDSSQATAGSTSYTRTIGKWADRHVRGTLTPGNVSLNSLRFESCYDPSSIVYSWQEWVHGLEGTEYWRVKRGSRSEYDAAKRRYGDANVKLLSMKDGYGEFLGLELRSDEAGAVATWIHNSGVVLGTINLKNGEFDIDLGVLKGGVIVNASNDTEFVSFEDLTYRIAYASHPAVGLPRKLYLGAADAGHVYEGENDIVAFADLDGSGTFTSGEPYGVVKNVGVSWKGVSAEIELTDASPVTPRFDVFAAGTMQVATTNIAEAAESSSSGDEESEITEPVRVRVVRWKIDDAPIYSMAVTPRVVFDKMMDPRVAATITERDFIDENTFDLDWDYFRSEVVTFPGVTSQNRMVVKADYLAIIGDGDVSWRRDETNKWLTASKQVITRYYGENRVMPRQVSPGSVSPVSSAMGVVNTANPTFAWTLDCPERESYTAFRIVVTNSTGTVYDSGIRRAPARDGDGAYRWAAPLYVDDITPEGKIFANKSTYGWRVAMYNSKFRTDSFTAAAPFYLEVQTNGYSTGAANVGVRYFGPAASYAGKVVRVQAFASPDFTGIPVAAGYVKDASTLAKTGEKVAANCCVVGLPEGKYYIRAFIDSNTNGACDEWESSGYLSARDGTSADWLSPTPITVGPGSGLSETAEIYLEDADTDNDDLPDSWEYALYGSLTAKGVELLSETPAGEELINASLVGALELRENAQVPAAGLATRVHASLRNAGTLALALGVNPAGYDSFAAAISGSVSDKLAEDGVKITSLSFVDGKVSITVDVETESGSELTGPLAASVAPKSSGLEVTAKVYWKQSLADSQWTLVAEKSFRVGSGETEIDAGDAVSGTSGFYKVEVEEKK